MTRSRYSPVVGVGAHDVAAAHVCGSRVSVVVFALSAMPERR
jgi:hypothetical protein